MNTPIDQRQPWSAPPDPMDPMVQMTSDLDDLSNIFNIDHFDLDAIQGLDDGIGFAEVMHQSRPGTLPGTPFDENMGGLGGVPPPSSMTQDLGGFMGGPQQQVGTSGHTQHQAGSNEMGFGNEDMFQSDMMQDYQTVHQQQQQQQQPPPQMFHFPVQQSPYPPSSHVPPTPNSYEMHGETGRFLQQLDAQQRALMEQQYHMRKNEHVQFTPMASPQGTPQFHLAPEYTVPGAYFSPLTSPALHAQNGNGMPRSVQQQQQHHQRLQGYYTNPSMAPSSNAASPIDSNADVEMGGDILTLPEAAPQSRKPPRKKVGTPRSLALNKIKQSPIQKAQKRKSAMLTNVAPSNSAEDMLQLVQQPGSTNAPYSAGLTLPPAFESSEEQSVSPEALSETLMGPPPKPGSSMSHSPAMRAQQHQQAQSTPPAGKAATPKSILSMKPTSAGPSGGVISTLPLDDLQLPAAARRPTLSQLDTAGSSEHTPHLAARKTPKLGPLDRPSNGAVSARPASASASPSSNAMPVSTPAGLLKDKKADGKAGAGARGAKKRGSVAASPGSSMLSPALRPRISPSIKPLLPEGALNSPTHALLLASKSNYQNLVEGNRLPGVNYPDSLSTGLTSKRTSHKVAEQGRRNRINDALKEMQFLIPSTPKTEAEAEAEADEEGGEGEKEREGRSQSSKAATVESAVKYIRVLKEQDEKQRTAMAEMKREMEELKRRLESLKGMEGEGRVSAAAEDAMDQGGSPVAQAVQAG